MTTAYSADIKKLPRHYLPEDFKVTDWQTLEPYFKELLQRPLNSKEELMQWLRDQSELEAAINEDACWRQINMTRDTENKALEEAFNYFCLEIQPHIQPYADELNKKLLQSQFVEELDQLTFHTFLRNIRKNIELYRPENIPLQAELAVMQQQFGQISGAMTVEVNGQEYTLQQAAKFLENPDRNLREEVYRKIQERRLQDKPALDELFDKLITTRHTIARNAGFENYVEYRFRELGRFDYTVEDCKKFQESVKHEVLPLVNEIYRRKQQQLKLENLRPWDMDAEPEGTTPLQPFSEASELLDKSIACFRNLNPFFADCLIKMKELSHLDLASRKGKAPGGYNCPLPETGAPFIFMNAAGQMQDVTTMLHEGGHAVHSFLAHPLPLSGFKDYPMEIAEVASMAMELFTMDQWHVFFKDPEDLKRAHLHQLERIITIFPWIAVIDKFQHWLYTHPGHTHAERTAAWKEVLQYYQDDAVDYSGLETYRANAWQRQLHLFEVPFYYIEYGIAQLGAIGMWKQYRENPEAALENYCKALSLGGTKTLPELYSAAGLDFDFSREKIKSLIQFVYQEWKKLN